MLNDVLGWLYRPLSWPLDAQIVLGAACALCLLLALGWMRSRHYARLAGQAFLAVSAELERAQAAHAKEARWRIASLNASAGVPSLQSECSRQHTMENTTLAVGSAPDGSLSDDASAPKLAATGSTLPHVDFATPIRT